MIPRHNVINAITTVDQAWCAYVRLVKAGDADPELLRDPDFREALKRSHARFMRIFAGDA